MMSKPVLFSQGNYFMRSSKSNIDTLFGISSQTYDVVNVLTGNVERKEPGFGYAVMWVKHLDFMYNKSLSAFDPDKEMHSKQDAAKAAAEAWMSTSKVDASAGAELAAPVAAVAAPVVELPASTTETTEG